jgi:hypothetical protein
VADSAIQELQRHIDGIEESYEFMLAYAAQGVSTDVGSGSGAQLRELLRRTEASLEKLAELFEAAIAEVGSEPREKYLAFVEVIREDARKARAAVGLTLAQQAISSHPSPGFADRCLPAGRDHFAEVGALGGRPVDRSAGRKTKKTAAGTAPSSLFFLYCRSSLPLQILPRLAGWSRHQARARSLSSSHKWLDLRTSADTRPSP